MAVFRYSDILKIPNNIVLINGSIIIPRIRTPNVKGGSPVHRPKSYITHIDEPVPVVCCIEFSMWSCSPVEIVS